MTDALAREIREKISLPDYAGWRIPRHNYIFGILTKGAGWYPDYQTRLLRVGRAYYDTRRKVHEVVKLYGEEGTLRQPLIHYNYRDLAQFKAKQERYARFDAQSLYSKGIRPKTAEFCLAAAASVLLALHHLGRLSRSLARLASVAADGLV